MISRMGTPNMFENGLNRTAAGGMATRFMYGI
jgi:hypothetical protein